MKLTLHHKIHVLNHTLAILCLVITVVDLVSSWPLFICYLPNLSFPCGFYAKDPSWYLTGKCIFFRSAIFTLLTTDRLSTLCFSSMQLIYDKCIKYVFYKHMNTRRFISPVLLV